MERNQEYSDLKWYSSHMDNITASQIRSFAASTAESLGLSVTAAAAVTPGGECPPATQDIGINLKNRKNAIDTASYGPLNPAEPNDEFWQALASEWNVDAESAKKQRCGNCAVFIKTPEMLACIEAGLGNEAGNEAMDVIDAGDLGYCEAFDFKCASARTCRAWVAGGPVTVSRN